MKGGDNTDEYLEKKRVLKRYLRAKQEEERVALVVEELEREDPEGKLERARSDLREKKEKKLKEMETTIALIEQLPEGKEKQLLTHRYIAGLEWEELAVKMSYSWTQIHRLHKLALKKINLEKRV